MIKILRLVSLLAIFVSLLLIDSCNYCMDCIIKDMNGNAVGMKQYCGSDLDDALAQPEFYDCN